MKGPSDCRLPRSRMGPCRDDSEDIWIMIIDSIAYRDTCPIEQDKGIQRSLNPEVKAYVDYRDLLLHEMDFVQYVLGHGIPDNCNCCGLISQLRDDREVPDTWVATYQFEKLGRTVAFTGSMNTSVRQPVEICGRDATLRFDDIAHNVLEPGSNL